MGHARTASGHDVVKPPGLKLRWPRRIFLLPSPDLPLQGSKIPTDPDPNKPTERHRDKQARWVSAARLFFFG